MCFNLGMDRTAPMLALPLKGEPNPKWVYEPKLDGVRVIAQKQHGVVSIYTRTFHEQKERIPHLESALAQVPFDFTLDGEIVSVEDVVEIEGQQVPVSSFSNVSSIIGSSPTKAVANQRTDKLMLVVFDCLNAQGSDTAILPDSIRRGAAELIVDLLRTFTEHVMLVPRWREANGNGLYEEIIKHGGEGLMVKNPLAMYKPGKRPTNTWYKMKATDTADVVIMGYKPGLGKYKGQIGAIEFGQYRNGRLVARSRCSGMSDAQRRDFTDNGDSYVGRVMEVKYFGRTGPERSFRHPVFVAIRDDKTAQECEWE